MKASELRIGNYIASSGNKQDVETWVIGKVISISSLDTKFEQIEVETNESFEWFFRDNYFGIPLTEEWLLKFGFIKGVSDDDQERITYSIQVANNTSLYFDRHKDWMRNDLEVEWYLSHEWNNNHFKNNFWNSPKYVHQLQNLYFALTGEELHL